MRNHLLLPLLAVLSCPALGQNAKPTPPARNVAPVDVMRELSGSITDYKTGEGVAGATVLLKGTTIGTAADVDGRYSFAQVPRSGTLQFSLLGYITQEVTFRDGQTVNVKLALDTLTDWSKINMVHPGREIRVAMPTAVSGRITDSQTGKGLPGVTVLLKGTKVGTAADVDGCYRLEGMPRNGILQFSLWGYVAQELPVDNQRVRDAAMVADPHQLSEVVVTTTWRQREKPGGCRGGGIMVAMETAPVPVLPSSRKQRRQARKATTKE